MANFNKVFLMGNLTRDPELRYIPSGMQVAEFGLAVNRKYRTQGGEDREETTFVEITVWGRQAETVSEYLSKGRPVFVEGRLKYDSWETQDGQKRSKLSVVGERVQFLGSRGDQGGGGGGRREEPPRREPPRREPPRRDPPRSAEPSVQEKPPDDFVDLDDIPF